jgi:Male sterility protein
MSSSPRIFVTGVSGYVGGHMTGRLLKKHPEWQVAVLVRDQTQKEIVLGRWPQLEAVIGDLDNSALMVTEGSKADVVLREYCTIQIAFKAHLLIGWTEMASADHISGVVSLIQGLSQRKPTPGSLIHIGGTGILHDTQNGFGELSMSQIIEKCTDFMQDNYLAKFTTIPPIWQKSHLSRSMVTCIATSTWQFLKPRRNCMSPLPFCHHH